MMLQAPPDAINWYQSPLGVGALLAIITAALAFAATRIHDSIRRRHESRDRQAREEDMRRLRREAMLISFFGEVQTMRNYIWSAAQRCRWCLELSQEPEIQSFRVPDDVFRAHAGPWVSLETAD